MPAPPVIGQPFDRTPTDVSGTRHRSRGLPQDLLRDASRRLSIIAMLAGVMWVAVSVLDHALFQRARGDPDWVTFKTADGIALVSALVSFALFFYTRRSDRSPGFILDLGHGFLIFTALALGLIWHWAPVPPGDMVLAQTPTVTWIGVLVLVFAAMVPSTVGKTLVTDLTAVSMNPLGMAIAKARGAWEYGSDSNLLMMHFPDYLLVSVAVVISYVVNRLGQQVTKAREMGSYQVGELLGEGGMGEVYRATHRMLARAAAIKLIRREMIDGGNSPTRELALKRFRREAGLAASLRSPHTVQLYDFGLTEDLTLYFVMELLEGMTLETLVRDHGPAPANRTIHILGQVCESLEEAHASGLVHRDIKPANIHIGRLGLRHDFVKVLDFGLVKSVAEVSGEGSLATGLGMPPGTPAYMAPEVTQGQAFDGRADLYAVGCVAYYLLTGHPTFEGANPFHVIARHLNDIPVPPSQHAGGSVPPALDQIVLACLAKRPDERPRDAAELARSLAAVDVEPWGEADAAAWWKAHDARVP